MLGRYLLMAMILLSCNKMDISMGVTPDLPGPPAPNPPLGLTNDEKRYRRITNGAGTISGNLETG